ncbi:MAG: hypothetical protein ACLGPL_06150 [Acidobacteriota bacterium]
MNRKLAGLFIIVFMVALMGASTAISATTDALPLFKLDKTITFVTTEDTSYRQSVDDAAGYWLYLRGSVSFGGREIGHYLTIMRGFKALDLGLNSATTTTTVYFGSTAPYQNITLQGTHDFGSGKDIGSVSAASAEYAPLIGANFVFSNGSLGAPGKLVLNW